MMIKLTEYNILIDPGNSNMGGKTSKYDESFRQNEWEEAHDIEIPSENEGQYTIVRNRITGELLDKYSLQFPTEKQYNKYLESISFRRNESNIVRVIHYEPKVVKEFCGSAYMLNVYLEHCRSRLSQYEDIPFPDYLYCAMAMLDGYKKLFSKIGRFHVSEHQVMIDQDGEIRVWLNEDYSENQAENLRYEDAGDYHQQEYEMVKDVMRIIFQNSDISEGPNIKLVDFYEREKNNLHHRVGFEEAKNIILDYSRRNQINIPELFKSVYEIYQGQEDDRHQDTMSFKNDLFHHELQDTSSHKVNYEPVQSIVSNRIHQVSSNMLPTGGPIPTQAPQVTYHHSGPPRQPIVRNPPQPPVVRTLPTLQQPAMQLPQRSIVPRPNPTPIVVPSQKIMAPPYFASTPQFRPQPQVQVGRGQQGFPIHIRPPQFRNDTGARVQSQSSQPRVAAPGDPRVNSARPQPLVGSAPVAPQQLAQSKPLERFTSTRTEGQYSPGYASANIGSNQIERKNKIATENVRKHSVEDVMYAESNNHEDDHHDAEINEANIIKDLSQLHKIQEQEKSKRSANESSGSNRKEMAYHDKDNQHEDYDGHYEKLMKQNFLHEDSGEEQLNDEIILREAESIEKKTSAERKQNQETNQTQSLSLGNKQENSKFPARPIRHQASTPFYSGFNPHGDNQRNQHSLELGYQGRELNQNKIITNQINQMQNNSEGGRMGAGGRQDSRRQIYYTLSNQVELDPEIAADLAMYS